MGPLRHPPRVAILTSILALVLCLACATSAPNKDGTNTHDVHFQVGYMNITRLCQTKEIIAVNGEFPGPTIYARTGDQINVKVTNLVSENISIHWHGVRQFFTVWSDGPAFITQCPLPQNSSFTHRFSVVRESGTLFWHAHISWLRATVFGALIILPKRGLPYPFPKQPTTGFPIVLGEWWNMDVLDVERYGLADGAGYNLSDALTINGQPGLLFNCSQQDAVVLRVKKGETYLLQVVNAAMNFQLYFQIANHKLTVVETDCLLTKPYTTNVMLLAPGQTADVLVTADQEIGEYYVAASVYSPAPENLVPFPTKAATALFLYEGAKQKSVEELVLPKFPAANDSKFAMNYGLSLRSLNSKECPSQVPQKIDESFLFTVGYSLVDCEDGKKCHGPDNKLVSASISNITFVPPSVSILQAYYQSIHGNLSGIPIPNFIDKQNTYKTDFPGLPQLQYNYTGTKLDNLHAEFGTKVKVLEYKSNVQLVLQSVRTLFFESHPFHLHGYNFHVVGMGTGNYNAKKDSVKFNLVDPPAMNTVAIPYAGWVAIRFYTDNPGVWLMHCHFEMHTSWGMQMVWIVKEGEEANEKLPPPPNDYPKCDGSLTDIGVIVASIEESVEREKEEAEEAARQAANSIRGKF